MQAIKADLTIVADGCFSKFRKDLSSLSVTVSSHFVGIVMRDCPQFKTGHAEIILTPKGPVLVYQISSSETRILIDIHGKMPSNMEQFLKDEIAPHLTGTSWHTTVHTLYYYTKMLFSWYKGTIRGSSEAREDSVNAQ